MASFSRLPSHQLLKSSRSLLQASTRSSLSFSSSSMPLSSSVTSRRFFVSALQNLHLNPTSSTSTATSSRLYSSTPESLLRSTSSSVARSSSTPTVPSVKIDPFYTSKSMHDHHYVSIAPMLDVSNLYFRHMAHLISPHLLIYSEMISSYVFEYNKEVSFYKKLMGDRNKDTRFVFQLSGNIQEYFQTSVRYLMEKNSVRLFNINCGCPSPRSSYYGRFGLYLMREPQLVAEIVQKMYTEYYQQVERAIANPSPQTSFLTQDSPFADMFPFLPTPESLSNSDSHPSYPELRDSVTELLKKKGMKSYKLHRNFRYFSKRLGAPMLPISVKCRIGIEDTVEMNSFHYEDLRAYIEHVLKSSGYSLNHFVIHLRKGIMNFKVNSSSNLRIPPLNYTVISRLQEDFPDLYFTFNGGVTSMEDTYKILTGDTALGENFLNNYIKHRVASDEKISTKKVIQEDGALPPALPLGSSPCAMESSAAGSSPEDSSSQVSSDTLKVNGFEVPSHGFNNKVMIGRYFVDNPYDFVKVNIIQHVLDEKARLSKQKKPTDLSPQALQDLALTMPTHPLKDYAKSRIKINPELYMKFFNGNKDYSLLYEDFEALLPDSHTSSQPKKISSGLPSRFDLLFAYIDSFILYERDFFKYYDDDENRKKLIKPVPDSTGGDGEASDDEPANYGRVNMTSFYYKKDSLNLYRNFLFDPAHPVDRIAPELRDFIRIEPTNYFPLKPSAVLKPIQNLFHSINFSSTFRKHINDHTNNSSYNTIFHSSLSPSGSSNLNDILQDDLPYVGFEIIFIEAFLQSFGNFVELDPAYMKIYRDFKEKYNEKAEEELYKKELRKREKQRFAKQEKWKSNTAHHIKTPRAPPTPKPPTPKPVLSKPSIPKVQQFSPNIPREDSQEKKLEKEVSKKKSSSFIDNFYNIKDID